MQMSRNISYELSINILKALGGDVSVSYPDADAVWNEINGIYESTGKSINIEQLIVDVTENGNYNFAATDEISGYAPVKVNVNVAGSGGGGTGDGDSTIDEFVSRLGYSGAEADSTKQLLINKLNTASNIYIDPEMTNFNNAFADSDIIIAPKINNTITDAVDMFNSCTSLWFVPTDINVSAADNVTRMFFNCPLLSGHVYLNSGMSTNFIETFYGCRSLDSITVDLSNAVETTNMCMASGISHASIQCGSNQTLTSVEGMFSDCFNLANINFNDIDFSNVERYGGWLTNCQNLQSFEGLPKNIGKHPNTYDTETMLYGCDSLEENAYGALFTRLYNRAKYGMSECTIWLSRNQMNNISEETIAKATTKGWIITQSEW